MAKILMVLLIPAFLSQVSCLQCNTCHGEYDCVGQNVTCEDPSASCTTSVRKAYVSFLEFQSVRKGCARQLYPPESILINSHLLSLSYQARYCAEDGCNNEAYFVTHPAPANHMRCHTCASQGAWCPETSRTQMTCVGDQDQCMDMDITGKLGQYSNLKLKGCTNMQRCEDILSFYSGSRTIHASCCNTPLCNSFTPDLPVLSQAYNGLECYSCMDDEGPGSGCSSKSMSKVQCTGPHTMCLEGLGNSRRAGKDLGLRTFKGCASPAMCQSSLLSLVQELDDADVICCQGNLCNNRIINGMVMGARVSAHSADITEVPECVEPSPAAPSVASRPDCIYTEEERNANAPNTAGVPPSPGSHIITETNHTVREKEVAEDLVTERAAVTASPHHEVHSVTEEHTVHDNLSRGPFEGNHVSPTGSPGSESLATSGSSVTNNLDKSVSGANSTSSNNHGNVVVLIPVVVSRRNNTASTVGTISSSSFSETNTNNRVLEASSNKDELEEEECEAEEEDVSTGDWVVAVGERNRESSTPEGTAVPTGGNSNADVNTGAFSTYPHQPSVGNAHGVHSHTVHSHSTGDERFAMEGNTVSHTPMPGHSVASNHATSGGENFVSDPSASQPGHNTSRPSINGAQSSVPFVSSKDSESFVSEGNNEAGVATVTNINTFTPTNSPTGAGIISGAEANNAHPKNKVPCKRPGSQRQPGGTLVPSSRTEKRSQNDGATREATNALFTETKNPRNDIKGKVNPNSGGAGLANTLHVFSLSIILVALLH